jgi:hypothetical protein
MKYSCQPFSLLLINRVETVAVPPGKWDSMQLDGGRSTKKRQARDGGGGVMFKPWLETNPFLVTFKQSVRRFATLCAIPSSS